MAADEPGKGPLARSLRGLIDGLLGTAQTRLELFVVEVQEEKLRLASLLFNTLLAAVFLGFGVVFLAVFLTVLFWDGYRLAALGAGTVVLIACGLLAARNAAREARDGSRLFAATLGEIGRDRDALRPRE
ncbi:MAG TPA: phage holin family protein [Aromatoleum sp.]|uniref:phage holin family protein n=1 Tax=Aromatoleum sp. TaxID=2307007 RepID=UPI002B471563|nr:phage holin family protein [Aromatoleum sp.]HJV24890.1 phage holin family protein [Aromatoleum sp.]